MLGAELGGDRTCRTSRLNATDLLTETPAWRKLDMKVHGILFSVDPGRQPGEVNLPGFGNQIPVSV